MRRVVLSLLPCLLGCPIDPRFGDADGSSDGGDATSSPATTGGPGSESEADAEAESDADETSGPSDDDSGGVAACGEETLRVATFNIREVGAVGTGQYAALVAVLRRIDADVVCLQEVGLVEGNRLVMAAGEAGYDIVVQADPSPPIGGEINNACIARVPMTLVGSFTGSELSSDSGANDVGRDLLAVRVEPKSGCVATLVTVHLKSGENFSDRFRRQIEIERLSGLLSDPSLVPPEGIAVALGDFNETIDEPAIGTVFAEVPSDLPGSYDLGDDIELPLPYDPFGRLQGLGLTVVDAVQEDSDDLGTFQAEVRLDYVMVRGGEVRGGEVYNACRDNGEDDDPPGAWLPKSGDPLDCSSSGAVSDHLPVFVDLQW